MPEGVKQLLDLALDLRHQRRRQHEAEEAQSRQAIEDAQAELRRHQSRFCGNVRSLMENALTEANIHLATRSEGYLLCDVSGHFAGLRYPGASVCNPIAYELHDNGQPVGEILLVELTRAGTVEASLCAFSSSIPHAHLIHHDLNWPEVGLGEFSDNTARDFVLRYVAAVATRSLH